MSELPPDRSIVAIKSCLYGTYLAAISDYKSVTLQKVSDPNKLPKNCLWTLRRKLIYNNNNKRCDSLKFKSCYGRYLALKGKLLLSLCQDELVSSFSSLGNRIWTYDRVGATNNGYRLVVMQDDISLLRARINDRVEIRPKGIIPFTDPDVYWTIHRVGSDDKPRALRQSLMQDEDKDEDEDEDGCQRCRGKGIITIINNNVGVPYYNHSTVIDSGKNVNLDGYQRNGGVIAGNKFYATETFRRFG